MSRIAFVTSAWWRDWTVVLDPKRYRMMVDAQRYDFPIRLIVLNNFKDVETKNRARRAAEALVEQGLATHVLVAQDYLQDEVLRSFEFEPQEFWRMNPFFSTSHLTALHFLRDKADWVLFFSGDVRLMEACDWIPRAMAALERTPQIRGFNLCRQIYQSLYPSRCDEENSDFWIGYCEDLDTPKRAAGPRRGLTLSDHAYVIPVNPVGGWRFGVSEEYIKKFYRHYPAYARPNFELYYWAAMGRFNFGHGALKPKDGFPITQHKNIPDTWKVKIYRWLGLYYRNRKHGTKFR